jgi:hypothetical protein
MGTEDGDDPRSPANRGWGWECTRDPRRIGDGDGGGPGPPIPGESGMGVGMDPRLWACAEQLHLVGSRISPQASFGGCHHPRKQGQKKTQRHPVSVYYCSRMLMLGAGLMLQCQLT